MSYRFQTVDSQSPRLYIGLMVGPSVRLDVQELARDLLLGLQFSSIEFNRELLGLESLPADDPLAGSELRCGGGEYLKGDSR